jgi:hypothetical protein
LLLISCGTKTTEVKELKTYSAVIVDSLSVERLSGLRMLDYNDENQEFLMQDDQLGQIIVMDKKGEVLSSFAPFTQGPNYIGNNSYGWSFYGNDEIVAYGVVYFYRLSKKGEIQQRLKYPAERFGGIILDYSPQRIKTFQVNGNTEVMTLLIDGLVNRYRTKTHYDTAKMVFQINFETGKSSSTMPRPATSIYSTAEKYIDPGYPIFSLLSEGIFAVTYQSEPSLFIFDPNANEYISKIEIPAEHQPKFTAVDFDSKQETERLKVNGFLNTFGDKALLVSFDQIPESIFKEITRLPQWWESTEWKEAVEKYLKEAYLLFDKNQFLGEVKFSFKDYNGEFLSTKSDFFWVKREYKDERDYQTFLKVKIVEDKQ